MQPRQVNLQGLLINVWLFCGWKEKEAEVGWSLALWPLDREQRPDSCDSRVWGYGCLVCGADAELKGLEDDSGLLAWILDDDDDP